MKKKLIPLVIAGLSAPALGLSPLSDPGLHGTLDLAVGGGEMETNFLARLDTILIDLSEKRIGSLGSADAESVFIPYAGFDIGWTFGNERTRISVGNDYTDELEFNRATSLSLRQDVKDIGQFLLQGYGSTAFTTELWRDPYRTEGARRRTSQEVYGGRLVWDRIAGSGLGLELRGTRKDINSEESGESIAGLDAGQRALLEREGEVYVARVSYHYPVDDYHAVEPEVAYLNRDLDGDAMAQEGFVVGMGHQYDAQKLRWESSIRYTYLDGDAVNPVFGEVNDATGWAVATEVGFPGALDFLSGWVPSLKARYVREDSDIDFNDTSLWLVEVGLSRRF